VSGNVRVTETVPATNGHYVSGSISVTETVPDTNEHYVSGNIRVTETVPDTNGHYMSLHFCCRFFLHTNESKLNPNILPFCEKLKSL
jgi:hypothetical protein